jgi:hypothetical protein
MWQNLIVILIGLGVLTYFLRHLAGVVRGGLSPPKCDRCSRSGCDGHIECPTASHDHEEMEHGPALR